MAASAQLFRASGDPALADDARLAVLEDTLRRFRGRARGEILRMVKKAIGIQLDRMEAFERAAGWFEEVLQEEPLNRDTVARLVNSLWKAERWDKAAQVMRKQLDLRGDAPGALYAYAKSLFEAGDINGAVTAAQRSVRLATDRSADTLRAATELRDRALDLGGKIIPPSLPPDTGPVSRKDFEAALDEFGRFIASKKRMTFWKKNDEGKRVWIPSPEAHGQNLLHTYMQAKFGDRIEIFEELGAGAGRIDLYVKLSGGLATVLELKICGNGYSSAYAASGETQLIHYMENRKTHLGYLVVFDSRIEKYGEPLLSKRSGAHTLLETRIDVRSQVK